MKPGYVLAVTNDPAVADELERMAREDFTSVRREMRWESFDFLIAIVVDLIEFEAWAAA